MKVRRWLELHCAACYYFQCSIGSMGQGHERMSLSLADTILVMPEHFAMLFSRAVFAFPTGIMSHVAGKATGMPCINSHVIGMLEQ